MFWQARYASKIWRNSQYYRSVFSLSLRPHAVAVNFYLVFCQEEVAQSIGVGPILWVRTGQFKTAGATCPIDNQNAVTGSGTRRCGGVFGTPRWEQPNVQPCPVEQATTKNISGLTQTLLKINVSRGTVWSVVRTMHGCN